MQCSGTAKSTGKPCGKHALKGKKYCGTCAPRYEQQLGPNNSSYRGAGRSSFLPKGVLERCQWLLQQGDLYDLTAEIALVQTQLTQAQEVLAEGDPADRWRKFRELLATLDHTWKKEDEYSVSTANMTMIKLRALARLCEQDRDAKKEIRVLSLELAKLQEAQAKMEKLHGDLIPANQLRAFFAALYNTTYNVIPDDLTGLTGYELRLNMARTLRRMFNRPELPERNRQQYANEFEELTEAKTRQDAIEVAAKDGGIRPVDEGHFDVDSKEVSDAQVLAFFGEKPIEEQQGVVDFVQTEISKQSPVWHNVKDVPEPEPEIPMNPTIDDLST